MKLRQDPEREKKGIAKILYHLRLRWTHGIIPGYYDFRLGIKNLVRWFPHIWKNRDWDSSYTIDMLIASLEFQKKCFSEHAHITDESANQKIDELEEVISLLKKYQDEFAYSEPVYAHFDAIYGENEMYFTPHELDKNGKPLSYEMKNTRQDKMAPEEYEKYMEEYKKMMEEAAMQRKADKAKAFQIIVEKSEDWFD